jgi:hypothetical protein
MNFFNKILLTLFSETLKKNRKFKNLHKGESCYLFGNGSSLKYYDLKLFNDKVSIGCNALFTHKDSKNLNLKYYYVGHPMFFHKFWKNPYSKLYEKNRVGEFYRKNMASYPETQFFISLSNYFGIRGDNINFIYHFGEKNDSNVDGQLDEVFAMMGGGALMGMLGLALYLGFTDITMVGCDYTFSPKMNGHFYEKGPEKCIEGTVFLSEVLNLVKDKVTIRTVTPHEEFGGDLIQSITYKALLGGDPVYKDNTKILPEADLKELDSMNMDYAIYKS